MSFLSPGTKRAPFADPTPVSSNNARDYENRTGSRQDWKPEPGYRTKEVGGWGGEGYKYGRDPSTGEPLAMPGTRISDEDVARYRALGERRMAPVQVDQTRANEAGAMQAGSLALLGLGARGQAPSRAQAMGQLSTENAIRNAQAQNAARGGGLRGISGSLAGVGAQTAQSNLQIGDMRGQEIARDRGGLLGGASTMRRQDIGVATEDARLSAAQQALDAQRQREFEKLGFDVRNAEMFGMVEQRKQEDEAWNAEQKAKAAESEQERQQMWDLGGMAAGAALGFSDRRAKSVVPAGSLAPMMRK